MSANRDIISQLQFKRGHSPYYYNGDNVWISQIIDTQGYDGAAFVILTGDLVDANATFAVLMQESDNSDFSSASDVVDADMVSQTPGTAPETAAAFQFDDDNEVRSIGYIGNKRYIRLYITASGNTGYANIAVLGLLGNASRPITHGAS